jgi:hypothetical protein
LIVGQQNATAFSHGDDAGPGLGCVEQQESIDPWPRGASGGKQQRLRASGDGKDGQDQEDCAPQTDLERGAQVNEFDPVSACRSRAAPQG